MRIALLGGGGGGGKIRYIIGHAGVSGAVAVVRPILQLPSRRGRGYGRVGLAALRGAGTKDLGL